MRSARGESGERGKEWPEDRGRIGGKRYTASSGKEKSRDGRKIESSETFGYIFPKSELTRGVLSLYIRAVRRAKLARVCYNVRQKCSRRERLHRVDRRTGAAEGVGALYGRWAAGTRRDIYMYNARDGERKTVR